MPRRRRWRIADTEELRLLVFEALGRSPRWLHQIRGVLEREMGPQCYRRMQRALYWLGRRGMARRTEDGWRRTRDGERLLREYRTVFVDSITTEDVSDEQANQEG